MQLDGSDRRVFVVECCGLEFFFVFVCVRVCVCVCLYICDVRGLRYLRNVMSPYIYLASYSVNLKRNGRWCSREIYFYIRTANVVLGKIVLIVVILGMVRPKTFKLYFTNLYLFCSGTTCICALLTA